MESIETPPARKGPGRPKGSLGKPKPPAPAEGAEAGGGGGRRAAPGLIARRAGARGPGAVKNEHPPRREERVERLIPYEFNARTHSQASIDKLARLIATFGWTSPILVAGRHILAGHARRLAAMQLGIELVPVIDLKHLSRAQQEAVILSDNRAAMDGGWDEGLLVDAFERLKGAEFDLSLTGFDSGEIADFLGTAPAVALSEPAQVGDEHVTCPSCGHRFAYT